MYTWIVDWNYTMPGGQKPLRVLKSKTTTVRIIAVPLRVLSRKKYDRI